MLITRLGNKEVEATKAKRRHMKVNIVGDGMVTEEFILRNLPMQLTNKII